MYLAALADYDVTLTAPYADTLVALYAEFAVHRLTSFLRASTSYNLEEVRVVLLVCSVR